MKSNEAIERHKKEWLEVWEMAGEPHPNSNEYLYLTRAFFYMKGMEDFAMMNKEVKDED